MAIKKKFDWILFTAKSSGFIGLLLIGWFIVSLNRSNELFGQHINFELTDASGAFIGGVVGAFWSLAGVLLYYNAFRLQKMELESVMIQNVKLLDAYKDQSNTLRAQNEVMNFQGFQDGFLKNRDRLEEIGNELTKSTVELNFGDVRLNKIVSKRSYIRILIESYSKNYFDKQEPVETSSEIENVVFQPTSNHIINSYFLKFGSKFDFGVRLLQSTEKVNETFKSLIHEYERMLVIERSVEEIIVLIYYAQFCNRKETILPVIAKYYSGNELFLNYSTSNDMFKKALINLIEMHRSSSNQPPPAEFEIT